ncbi:RIIa domain-containing protein 1 [Triplophysa tibetana]|uniref:RIIa domain-containing protein 1 n=1 Tax=Triplophysa tibetana TaxID=1572043 RepID=A0A5A9N0L4_9TELE|nr:RIIa domain-containing protein 1 [Triplophysa tibetana]
MAESGVLEKLDFGALSTEQQERLRQFKIKTRMSNEKYLRSHPEVDLLLSDFLREVFLKRPTDIREFAAGGLSGRFFNDFQSLNANLSKKMLSQLDAL